MNASDPHANVNRVHFVWPAPPGTSFDQSVCDRLIGQTVGKGKVLSAYIVRDGWGVGMVLDWAAS